MNSRSKIDVMIGVNFRDFHFSLKDIRVKPGQPIARLNLLGWNSIRNPNKTSTKWHQNQYTRTYFSSTNGQLRKIGDNIRKFWDAEDISGKLEKKLMSLEDKVALKMVEKSTKPTGQRYEVVIP